MSSDSASLRVQGSESFQLSGKVVIFGVIARRPEYLPWIAEALTPEVIVDWMSHVLDPLHGRVERWYLPGSHSLNFLLENALGGGGIASLRIDPQGKAFAQQLLEIPIAVPRHIADQLT